MAWELTHGSLRDEDWVLHHCDNPRCVNPAHLFLGDRAANMADMVAKGRSTRGTVVPGRRNATKLSERQARLILKLSLSAGANQRIIAKRFGVSQSMVSAIKVGSTWAHVRGSVVPRGTRCGNVAG